MLFDVTADSIVRSRISKLLKDYAFTKYKMIAAEKVYKRFKRKANKYRIMCENLNRCSHNMFIATKDSPYVLRKKYHHECTFAKINYKKACREFSKVENVVLKYIIGQINSRVSKIMNSRREISE